ncbi:hypothetical protein EV127DRAFT_488495 [Xylaria flabelliformis]|nr:hypothetical protein EV127DRAFT_488495 [Xylaria flabelliformis]
MPLTHTSSFSSTEGSKSLHTPKAHPKASLDTPISPCSSKDSDKKLSPAFDKFDEILSAVLSFQCGIIPSKNPTFLLRGQPSYNKLLSILKERDLQEYFDTCLRYQWSADSGELTLLLMPPGPLHETFRSKLDFGLQYRLQGLAEQYPLLAPFVESLDHVGRSAVESEDKTIRRSPDGQFRCKDSEIPTLVYEVTDSQSGVKLSKVSQIYLERWPNELGAVIGFEFCSNQNQKLGFAYSARVFLWRADVIDDIGDGEKNVFKRRKLLAADFRHKGQALPGSLDIPFELFILPYDRHLLPAEAATASIKIDFAVLNEWAARAERQQRIRGLPKSPKAKVVLKRKPPYSEDDDDDDRDNENSLKR